MTERFIALFSAANVLVGQIDDPVVGNVTQLTALGVISYILVWGIKSGLPRVFKMIQDSHAEDRERFLKALEDIGKRDEQRSKDWQTTINRAINHCIARHENEKSQK